MKKTSSNVMGWIAAVAVIGCVIIAVVRAWRKRDRAREQALVREQQVFAERLEKSIRDLNTKVSELTRNRF